MFDTCKMVESSLNHSIRFCSIFQSLKQNFIAYHSSKVSDCIFEIHQLWQSGFSQVYSNCFCSCSFEAEIIKICRSSHKMYSNNILNCQESTTILNTCTKKNLETFPKPLVFQLLHIGHRKWKRKRNNHDNKKSHQKDNLLRSPFCKIIRTILQIRKGETQTNKQIN